jgi:hypothetical protein
VPAALYAAGIEVPPAVAVAQTDTRGVSDPHLAAPFFAPRPARRGSLTPNMQVMIIRRDSANVGDTVECAALSRSVARAVHFSR